MPREAFRAGIQALTTSWRMVTNEAITTMKAGILTLSGTRLFIAEMTMLEQTSTTAVAIPIISPL